MKKIKLKQWHRVTTALLMPTLLAFGDTALSQANHNSWTVNNLTISWNQGSGYFQVQGPTDQGVFTTVENCEGAISNCTVDVAGTYSLLNFNGTHDRDIPVPGNTGGNDGGGNPPVAGGEVTVPTLVGNDSIQLPGDAYYIVRNNANNYEVCAGVGTLCVLGAGDYRVELINSVTFRPDRTWNIEIPSGSADGGNDDGSNDGFPFFTDNKLKDVRLEGSMLSWNVPSPDNGQYRIILNDNDAGGNTQTPARRADHVFEGINLGNFLRRVGDRYLVDLENINALNGGLQPGQNFAVDTAGFAKSRVVTVPSTIGVNVVEEAVPGFLDRRGNIVGSACNASNSNNNCADQIALDQDTIDVLLGDWTPVFRDDFDDAINGAADGTQLVNRYNNGRFALDDQSIEGRTQQNWYFAEIGENGEFTGISPHPNRLRSTDDQHAALRRFSYANNGQPAGVLEMSANRTPNAGGGQYTYMATADNNSTGWFVDPSVPVFIETSVRLDRAVDAVNAWWAVWLMTPGRGGNGLDFAYDCNPDTGSEVDLFEFVPEAANGFNTAIFRGIGNCNVNGRDDSRLSVPTGSNFTYRNRTGYDGGRNDIGEIPNYVDGQYHKIGMYYSQDRYSFFIDNQLVGSVVNTDTPNQNWISRNRDLSLRLTWEIDDNNAWGVSDPGLRFSDHAQSEVYSTFIDYIHIFQSTDTTTVLPPPPAPAPAPEPEEDTDPPNVRFLAPGAGVEVDAGSVTISGTVDDPSGVRLFRALLLSRDTGNQRYDFSAGEFNDSRVYNDTVPTIELTNQTAQGGDWSFTIDDLEPGRYRLRTKGWDNNNIGHVPWGLYDFTVVATDDIDPPEVSFIAPGAGATVDAGSVTISGTVDDPSGVRLFRALLLSRDTGNQRYDFSAGEFSDSRVYNDTVSTIELTNQTARGGDWSFTIDDLEPGRYRLRTKGWDNNNIGHVPWGLYDFTVR